MNSDHPSAPLPTPVRLWAALLAGLVLLVVALHALTVVLGEVEGFVVEVPDDAYYYLGIARGRVETGTFTFDGGQTLTTGFHLLWVYALLPLVRLAGDNDRLLLALATGSSALVALTTAVLLCFRALRTGATGRLLTLAVFISGFAFVHGQISAMEWPLCIAISAGLFALLARTDAARPRRLIALFLLGVFGSFARSDFGGVPLCCFIAALAYARAPGGRRRLLAGFTALAGAAVGLLLFTLHQHAISGNWVQGSAQVKAAWGAAAGYSPAPVLHQFARTALYVPSIAAENKLELKETFGFYFLVALALLAPLASLAAWRWRRSWSEVARGILPLRDEQDSRGFLFVAAALTCLAYLALYGANPAGIQVWYTAHVWVPGIILAGTLLDRCLAIGTRTLRLVVLAGATVIVGLNLAVFQLTPPVYEQQRAALPMARLLAAAHEDGRIAGRVGWSDAGIVGYFAGGWVINVDGLANDEIADYLPDRLPCYLLDRRIGHVSSFGAAAATYLPPIDWAGFSTLVPFTTEDGFTIHLYEVDFERLGGLAECSRTE